MSKELEAWISNQIHEEKVSLMYEAARIRQRIAQAAPLGFGPDNQCVVGDEYDQAREALGKLVDRLRSELPGYKYTDLTFGL